SLLLAACSGLSTLTPEILDQAESRWQASRPPAYSLTRVMEGDRGERGEFDVEVQANTVTSLKRNGVALNAESGKDYSMEGLFRIIHEEIDLAKTPTLFGAPPGYSAYLMASFDQATGGLK